MAGLVGGAVADRQSALTSAPAGPNALQGRLRALEDLAGKREANLVDAAKLLTGRENFKFIIEIIQRSNRPSAPEIVLRQSLQ